MARNRGGERSRGDITTCVEQRGQEYDAKTQELTETTEDVQTERDAIEQLQGLGTVEGTQGVTSSLEQAEATSQGEFQQGADSLKESQAEGQECEGELQERSDATAADGERISQARQEVKSGAAGASLESAEAQANEDVEFLRGEEERAREGRESAEQQYEQLVQIVFGAGGGT